ncbi:MAG: discoidin domain-containing protein, partial [Arenimonas sp.]
MSDRFHTLLVRALLYVVGAIVLVAAPIAHADAPAAPRVLDAFEDPTPWSVVASTQVTGVLRAVGGVEGKALCLDYDFHGVSGYVGIRRALPLDYPADYAFDFRLRGDSPRNNLEFKLVDASGDNVWWVQRPNRVFSREWQSVRYRKRHVSKAWGPSPETGLKHSESVEFTLASGTGGKGSVCFDQLRFTPLTPDDGSPLSVTRQLGRGELRLDLGRVREFGGLSLHWPTQARFDYALAVSDNGRDWRVLGDFPRSDGGDDWIALTESEGRFLRVSARDRATRAALPTLLASVEPLAFGASTNAFLQAVAARAPRGEWPRGF